MVIINNGYVGGFFQMEKVYSNVLIKNGGGGQ